MKKSIFFSVISLLFCLSAYGQSFKEDFWAAIKAKNLVKAQKILETWDFADANDSELYISYFNFYTIKSLEKDSTVYEKEYTDKALSFISEGIERFPTRFDMRIVKIYMLGRIKEFPSFTEEILNFIRYSAKIGNNWKGENFSLIENPVDMFDGAVLEFQGLLLNENDASLHKDIIQISDEMLKFYPKHIQSRLNKSTIYLMQNEYDKSIEVLLKAVEIDEKNPIVLFNLAHAYGLKGDMANTKRYYELTVTYAEGKDEKLKDAAQRQLNALK